MRTDNWILNGMLELMTLEKTVNALKTIHAFWERGIEDAGPV